MLRLSPLAALELMRADRSGSPFWLSEKRPLSITFHTAYAGNTAIYFRLVGCNPVARHRSNAILY